MTPFAEQKALWCLNNSKNRDGCRTIRQNAWLPFPPYSIAWKIQCAGATETETEVHRPLRDFQSNASPEETKTGARSWEHPSAALINRGTVLPSSEWLRVPMIYATRGMAPTPTFVHPRQARDTPSAAPPAIVSYAHEGEHAPSHATSGFKRDGMLGMFAARSGRWNGHRPRSTNGGQEDGQNPHSPDPAVAGGQAGA